MANDCIKCRNNKVTVVDPNVFDNNYISQTNVPVPLEDLNISVVLKTSKRARTVITSDGTTIVNSTPGVSINFIEGSDINGEKVITTKYTDLTTVFDKDTVNSETLGITNIDIDFNASMAPMITIDFIDVRGSSIFQNDENLGNLNSNNKYSVFFQMPYPLFELEIKGYYGKTVTYCLHMLKFNSKFNSQTGNFEITCQFIGYTYAMLSDMINGYLKAISCTECGKRKYEEKYKNISTLNKLMTDIENINEGLTKVSNESEAAQNLNDIKEAKGYLDDITNTINLFGSLVEIDYSENDPKDSYRFIVCKNNSFDDNQNTALRDYIKNIEILVNKYNDKNFKQLDLKLFKDLFTVIPYSENGGSGLITDITKNKLNSTTSTYTIDYKTNLLSYLTAYYSGDNDDFEYKVFNMNSKLNSVNDAINQLDNKEKEAKVNFSNELKDNFRRNLGFDPTIRNIIEVITTAVEILMECIYETSQTAEQSPQRKTILNKKFNDKNSTDLKLKQSSTQFYPWPSYRERNAETKTFVDKFLGSALTAEESLLVPEVKFILDLHKAFIACEREANQELISNQAETTNWMPVNVLDSALIQDKQPFDRDKDYYKSNVNNIYKVLLIRAMTFIGYTNDENLLTVDEVKLMGKLEAEALIFAYKQGLIDANLLNTLINATNDSIFATSDSIKGVNRRVVLFDGVNDYYYNLINNDTNVTTKKNTAPVLQVSNYSDTDWDITKLNDNTYLYKDKSKYNKVTFLTDYTSNNYYTNKRDIDGCEYIKILPFKQNTNTLISSDVGTTTPLVLSKIKNAQITNAVEAGYNTFGGLDTYGIFETKEINYESANIPSNSPIIIFYNNINKGGGFARKRNGEKSPEDLTNENVKLANFGSIQPGRSLDFNSSQYINDGGVDVLHVSLNKNRELLGKNLNNSEEITYPYIEQCFGDSFNGDNYKKNAYGYLSFSLFGSKWFYLQDRNEIKLQNNTTYKNPVYAQALLFLNTLPFNGNGIGIDINGDENIYEIIHLFDIKGGIVHAPRLWCAYVGGILWRMSKLDPVFETDVNGNKIIVGGGSGKDDPINWEYDINKKLLKPNKEQFFPMLSTNNNDIYIDIANPDSINGSDNFLITLPYQVKAEFKRMFFEFVNGQTKTGELVNNSWSDLLVKLRIWDGSSTDFCTYLDNIPKNNQTVSINEPNYSRFLTQTVRDNYIIASPYTNKYLPSTLPNAEQSDFNRYYDTFFKNSFFLELKDDSSAVNSLITYLKDEVIITNSTYNIWKKDTKNLNYAKVNSKYVDVTAKKTNLTNYFDSLKKRLKENQNELSKAKEQEKIEENIFGTTNKDTINLILYNTCKNIYDKWLGGVTSESNIIFKCNNGLRLPNDALLSKKYRNVDTPRLIDSFRFISRSFKDIGDKLYINPTPVNKYLKDNPNTSSIDLISSLLDSNKFTFTPLPTFIDFKDEKNLKAIFTPTPNYDNATASGTCGPSFVCVYAGQTSRNLDLGDSEYENDGFDFKCDGTTLMSIPEDFSDVIDTGEDPVAVFSVTYGQQNQNVFSDIVLDQSEFTETDESLKIQDKISNNGAETNRQLVGQNLYNVYSVRSYKAEVNMLGNPMIQPMMYFQLENIPMFHGAYMIIRVKHNIKPNHMTTTFTGVRTRYAETPLVTAYDLYMSIYENLNSTGTGGNGGGGGTINSAWVSDYYTRLVNNPPNNNIIQGSVINKNIITTTVTNEKAKWEITTDTGLGVSETSQTGKNNIIRYNEALGFNTLDPWSAVWVSYVAIQGDSSFMKSVGHYYYITDGMKGVNGYEVFALSNGLKIKAEVGDILCIKGGEANGHCDIIWKIEGDTAYIAQGNWTRSLNISKITLSNGYITDSTDLLIYGSNRYVMLMKKTNNKYYNNQNLLLGGNTSTVGNTGSDADYWSLVAICTLEIGTAQGRCDVAQSIYNRLKSQKYTGNTIKELINTPKQYTPVGRAKTEFANIKDKDTAVKAVMKANNLSNTDATNKINATISALNDNSLKNKSRIGVGGRTDFVATSVSNNDEYRKKIKKSTDAGLTTFTRDGHVYGWFVGDGAIAYGKTNPSANPIPNFDNIA